MQLPDDTIPDAPPEGFARRDMRGGFLTALAPIWQRRDADGVSTFGLRIQPRHCNAMDMGHGGMLSTFADIVLGLGSYEQAKVQGFFITISLTTDYLAPAPLGAWLQCRPELVRATRSILFIQGVFTADGVPCLRANGLFKPPPPPR